MNESEVRDSLKHLNITTEEIKTFIPAVQEILLPIMEEVVVENKTSEAIGDINELEKLTQKTIKKK